MTTKRKSPRARLSSLMNDARTFDLLAICLLFFGFAGQGIRNIVGFNGSGAVMVILFVPFVRAFIASGASILKRPQPVATLLYVLVCALSTAWSLYPIRTATAAVVTMGITATGLMIAAARPLERFIDLLIRSFQSILVISYAFELFVSLIWRSEFAPIPMIMDPQIPKLYYWSNNALFHGGPIQGFMGNRNPLAFVALLLIIALAVRWAATRRRTASTLLWIGLSILTLGLTRSGTVTVALVVSVIAGLAFILVASVPERARPGVVFSLVGLAMVATAFAVAAHEHVTSLLGKSPDLTGRADIWRALIPMWWERPILGWGWTIGYPTELPVFAHFIPREDGSPTTQAHNAYIEALFLTGVLGAALVTLAVLTLLIGTCLHAVQRIDADRLRVAPAILTVALVVQSTVESRLLYEGNWMLFVVLAAYLAVDRPFHEHWAKRRLRSEHRSPADFDPLRKA